MGRAEKYANVIDEYEEKLKKEEEKLSITRELKFSELQKEIDNTVTIADYEEIENIILRPRTFSDVHFCRMR